MASRSEIVSSLRDQLRTAGATATPRSGVSTNLAIFDAFASTKGGLASGAIHEVLADPKAESSGAFESLIASAALASKPGGWIVWSDPHGTLYPPALTKAGVPVDRLLILRPRWPQEELWAIAECLRCAGVAATVAHVGRLTPVQARRLQLAAEQGGGVGVLVRPDDARANNYAAATRWRVSSVSSSLASGDIAQRWNVELVYGHGGRVGQSFLLEVDRETGRARASTAAVSAGAADLANVAADHSVRRTSDVAHRPRATEARRSSA